jgi:glycosyltransferase involved in cell wall biosynthesis
MVGKRTYLSGDIFAAIEDLDLQADVKVLGEVPLADLPLLHCASDLFVFPSLSEGFGLPPLEAMACGSPVVTSDATSLPEVVGDAAITVNAHDEGALSNAMHDVLTNVELRQELSRRGPKRAQLFSNRRMAESTLAVYDEVLSGLSPASAR